MKKNISTIKQIDKTTFAIKDITCINISKTFHIKYRIIIILFLCVIIGGIFFIKDNISKKSNITPLQKEQNIEVTQSPFNDNGFIFPESDSSYIIESDIVNLQNIASNSGYTFQELLRFSINEIYARHGQIFGIEKYENFYNNYEWYQHLNKITVTWDMFNSYEKYNLDILINCEKENGFR